jgi:hypothetical protein
MISDDCYSCEKKLSFDNFQATVFTMHVIPTACEALFLKGRRSIINLSRHFAHII